MTNDAHLQLSTKHTEAIEAVDTPNEAISLSLEGVPR